VARQSNIQICTSWDRSGMMIEISKYPNFINASGSKVIPACDFHHLHTDVLSE
jgi:hypothetical protein